MAQKVRSAQSSGGPNLSDGMWLDNGETAYFASFTSTSTPTYYPISCVPQDLSVLDALPGLTVGSAIYRIGGSQFGLLATGMAAQTTLNLGLCVIRNYCTLSAQITAAGGALTSLAVTPTLAYLPSGSVLTITNATPTTDVWTTSAAVSPGSTSIPVSSHTPSATYAIGAALNSSAGGGALASAPTILFGYVSGGSGTPAFPAFSSIQLPAITTNLALTSPGGVALSDAHGGYVQSYPGDITCLTAFSAGSVTVQAGFASSMVS